MGRNVSLREKIGEKCLLGRKVLGRNVLGRKVFWGETSEYQFKVKVRPPNTRSTLLPDCFFTRAKLGGPIISPEFSAYSMV